MKRLDLLLFLTSLSNALEPGATLLPRQYDFYEVEIDPDRHDVEFFSFVTRPDIIAPRWQLEIFQKRALEPGHWFIAPYIIVDYTLSSTGYVGPHIYDQDGNLIWSGAPLLNGSAVFDFKVSSLDGRDMLSMIWLRENSAVFIDDTYEIHQLTTAGGNAQTTNMHDFRTIEDGTEALYLTRKMKRTSRENSLTVGFRGRCNVLLTGFEERSLRSEEVLFAWSPEEHIGLDESTMARLQPGECEDIPWDYLHANSIEKLPDGDYLLSAHNTYAVYKISRHDGSIVWRLGGKRSDFHWSRGDPFTGQHDAHCRMQNDTHMLLSILDNANGPGEPRIGHECSRGLLISLRIDVQPMTAEIIASYDHPYQSYTPARGNFQTLPNGNAFMGWSLQSLQSEHSPTGELLMRAKLRSGLKTYRSFKFPWVGRPKNPPDVHAIVVTVGQRKLPVTIVHVSWNGATEVASWDLYKICGNGTSELVATSSRTGFETALVYHGLAEQVFVVAIAANGTVIGESSVCLTDTSPDTLHPGVVEQLQAFRGQADDSESEKTGQSYGFGSSRYFSSAVGSIMVIFLTGVVFGLVICALYWPCKRLFQTIQNESRHDGNVYTALDDLPEQEHPC